MDLKDELALKAILVSGSRDGKIVAGLRGTDG